MVEMHKFTLSPALPPEALPRVPRRVSVRDMHAVYRAGNLFDAHLVKDALEAWGIPAFIAGEYLTGGVGQLPAMDYIAVMVPESSVAEAGSIVREVEARLVEARQAIDEGDLPDNSCPAPC